MTGIRVYVGELIAPRRRSASSRAVALDSSRLGGDNRYDEERNCWCAEDSRGRMYRFEIEAVTTTDVAA
jgi:hypothetical protein